MMHPGLEGDAVYSKNYNSKTLKKPELYSEDLTTK